ncbi:hypothetical protein GCM10020367_39940 [Streptomyces sannanensis]|uniref:Integral membrane protein n=1 Tax=Streptomyces sannanensis TaxID=285536 RepID=A0ABP6SFD7_9ACTN
MPRRPVAAVAAIVLVLEALGIVFVHWVLARMVDGQNMSLGGLDPDLMFDATWAMGGAMGLFLAGCGVVLLRTAVGDRAPGRFGRVLLIGCAIVHGVLGALTAGLVGWDAFAFMMAVLGLLVLTLVLYEKQPVEPVAQAGLTPTDP